MNLEFECTKRNFNLCEMPQDIAFYMAIDIMNICGELAKNFPYKNENTQMDIAKSVGMQLVDAVENYRSGKLHVWDKKDLELSYANLAKLAEKLQRKETE